VNACSMSLDGATGGKQGSIGDSAKLGVITVSDRATSGVYDDASGPAIVKVCAHFRN
jgi:hypothetical protein